MIKILKFANIYNNDMVLQQQMPMTVWGYGDEGDGISVSLSSVLGGTLACAEAVVENGKWTVELPAISAAKNLVLCAKGSSETIECKNVAVGEVWFCSGQSNAECDFNYCTGTEKYVEEMGTSDFRLMEIEPAISFEERENGENVRWIIPDKSNMAELGVIPAIFGHCLAKKLDGVAVAVVRNYRGGNCLFTYISDKLMRSRPEYAHLIGIFNEEKRETKAAWSMIPVAYYNAVTVPIKAFRFRGMLWYQGESDSSYDRPRIYKQLFLDTMDMWREMFRNPDMPILSVELCPFEMEPFDFKTVRQAQYEIAKENDNFYLVSTADLGPTGEEGESAIHPKYKTPVGERAALLACGEVYKNAVGEWNAPFPTEITYKNGTIEIKYKHAGTGLKTCGDELKGFEFSVDGVYFHAAQAEISSHDSIIIKNAEGARIVRYCCVNISEDNRTLGGTLTNDTDIPAFPFSEFINEK